MASWSQFADERPDLAELVLRLLPTLRHRLSRNSAQRWRAACAPCVSGGGRLFVGIGPSSPKQWDLRRDSRCALHALPGENDAEFVIRARAVEVSKRNDRDLFEAACRGRDEKLIQLLTLENAEADGPAERAGNA